MKKIIFCLLYFTALNLIGQGWVGNSTTQQIYSVNGSSPPTTVPLFVGIGTNKPQTLLHTDGTLRFENLANNNTFDRILVQNSIGDVRWRDASTIGGSANAWLLGGNSFTSSPPPHIGTNTPHDFLINAGGFHRGTYTKDSNYQFGKTNNFSSSVFSVIQGTKNDINGSLNCGIFGGNSTINPATGSQFNYTIGNLNTINGETGDHNIVLGLENNTNNSSSAHNYGTHNYLINSTYGFNIGNTSQLKNAPSSFNIGNNNRLFEGDKNFNIGSDNQIGDLTIPNGTFNNYTFGSNLDIQPNTISQTSSSFLIGEGISNESSYTMRMGFGTRTMSLTEKGVSIQVSPSSPTYLPSHHFEVEAAHLSNNRSNIQFLNLPATTDSVDLVVYNRANHEVFRRPFNFNSGNNNWLLLGNTGTNPSINFLGTIDNQRLVFRTSNQERMTIHKDQAYIGIKTPAPNANLDINNTTCDNNPGLQISNDLTVGCLPSGTNGDYINCRSWNGAAFNPAFKVTNEGQVGVNIATPTSTMHVNGSFATNVLINTATTRSLSNSHHTIIHTGAAANFNLPLVSSCVGRNYVIINHGSGIITFNPSILVAAGTTINTVNFTTGNNTIEIVSDGTNWRRIR